MPRRLAPAAALAAVVAAAVVGGWGAAAGGASDRAGRPVALVVVPDLQWRDAPAALDGFARANLSMRSAKAGGDASDGYLTLGKGARSDAPAEGLGPVVGDGDGLRVVDWGRLRRHDDTLHYPGELGTLGATLERAGAAVSVELADPAAAVLVAGSDGVVRPSAGLDAPVVVVQTSPARLADALRDVQGRCVLVSSASTSDGNRHLGVAAASPECGLGRAGLTSATTQQPNLVTLPDVTATFLSLAGADGGATKAGAAITAGDGATRQELVDRDRRAFAADRARTPFVWTFIVVSGVAAAAVVAVRRLAPYVSTALLGVPTATFLVGFVPWWRARLPGLLLGVAVLAAALAVAALVAARRDRVLAVGLQVAALAAVIAVDALFRSPLQLDSPFGNSPVVGGRYYGMGNVPFGFLMAALAAGGGLALDRWGRRALPWVVAALVGGVVVDGAPAFAVLVLAWRRGRPWRRPVDAVWALAATAAVLAALTAWDLLGPSGGETHLGRFVRGDGAADIIARKADRAIGTWNNPMALLVVVGVLVLLALRPRLAGRPALQASAWSLLVLAILGTVLNDSGVLVAAAVTAVSWPVFATVAGVARSATGSSPVAPRQVEVSM